MTTDICTLALWAIVESACQTYDLPAETVYELIIAESGGDPQAVGALGELGVAQFQETTFKRLASLYETGYQWPQDAIDSEKAVDLLCRALLDELGEAQFQEAINDYHADAECVASTIETLVAQREVVNGRGWLARAENELDACFMDAAPLDQAYAWCDNWAYALIEEVKQLSRERVDMGELCGDARIGRMVRDLLKLGGGHMPISSLEAMTHD